MRRFLKIFSAVDHVVEHPQVWTERLSKARWGDRIPHLERSSEGTDCWVFDGRNVPLSDVVQVGALMSDRGVAPTSWDDVPGTAFVPAERLKAMEQDGVQYSVLYPTVAGFSGQRFATFTDCDLELACVKAYNDWLVEEWAGGSDRFIPQCIVPIWPVHSAVAEIKRANAKGHKGVIFPAVPMHLRDVPHINDAAYDPIWATCQDLGMPLCFHAGSSSQLQFPLAPTLSPQLAAALSAVIRPASAVFDLVNTLFSRILLRFSDLKVVFAESTIGWGTFILEYADHQYAQDHCEYELKPSEMFSRQCYLTSWYDPVKINADHIGIGNVLWSTNYPLANSSWPDTQDFIDKCFKGVTEGIRRSILWDNAARLYKIDLQKGGLL
jgi:predicted TIM-barrel fold metal-dependent hydrolase